MVVNTSYAISIGSLFEVADDNDSAIVNVVNNDDVTMFVKLSSSKLSYENGERSVTELDKFNVGSWGLKYTPSFLILEPGEEKSVRLQFDCTYSDCDRTKDIVYGVDFAPEPYVSEEQDTVKLVLGYKLYFVIPTEKPDYKYSLKRLGPSRLSIENNGNATLVGVLNNCENVNSSNESCVFRYRLIPGNMRTIELPSKLNATELVLTDLHGQVLRKIDLSL
ncbi:hypothetical protein J7G16_004201 [Vibrio parahaemolyticus]|nr:hypothetical protein [Vibrio parahaemolyticus]